MRQNYHLWMRIDQDGAAQGDRCCRDRRWAKEDEVQEVTVEEG